MTTDLAGWKANSGNATVYSMLVRVITGVGDRSFKYAVYSNLPLLPYLGQPGWVIEYPEYRDGATTSPEVSLSSQVHRWVQLNTRPEILLKLLRGDRGLYRMRWLHPPSDAKNTYLYPDAMIRDEDFCWNVQPLRALYKGKGITDAIRVEQLALVHSEQGPTQYRWVPDPEPQWLNEVCYRLCLPRGEIELPKL